MGRTRATGRLGVGVGDAVAVAGVVDGGTVAVVQAARGRAGTVAVTGVAAVLRGRGRLRGTVAVAVTAVVDRMGRRRGGRVVVRTRGARVHAAGRVVLRVLVTAVGRAVRTTVLLALPRLRGLDVRVAVGLAAVLTRGGRGAVRLSAVLTRRRGRTAVLLATVLARGRGGGVAVLRAGRGRGAAVLGALGRRRTTVVLARRGRRGRRRGVRRGGRRRRVGRRRRGDLGRGRLGDDLDRGQAVAAREQEVGVPGPLADEDELLRLQLLDLPVVELTVRTVVGVLHDHVARAHRLEVQVVVDPLRQVLGRDVHALGHGHDTRGVGVAGDPVGPVLLELRTRGVRVLLQDLGARDAVAGARVVQLRGVDLVTRDGTVAGAVRAGGRRAVAELDRDDRRGRERVGPVVVDLREQLVLAVVDLRAGAVPRNREDERLARGTGSVRTLDVADRDLGRGVVVLLTHDLDVVDLVGRVGHRSGDVELALDGVVRLRRGDGDRHVVVRTGGVRVRRSDGVEHVVRGQEHDQTDEHRTNDRDDRPRPGASSGTDAGPRVSECHGFSPSLRQ